MNKKLVLVKLGGGVITDKKVRYGLEKERLERLSEDIAKAWQEISEEAQLIVGNGAGSFAHFSAKKYGTKNGFNNKSGAIGAGWVHWDAVKLNQLVVESLLKFGVPAFSLSPATMMVNKVGEVGINLESLKVAMEKGVVPVVYGDVIIDMMKGSTIFSTEKVFEVLVAQLTKEVGFEEIRIIQVGKEKGVMKDLKSEEIIPVISRGNWGKVKTYLSGSGGVDVTGGMLHKVEMSLKLADKGIETWIGSGLKEDNVYKAIKGKEVEGTKIIKSSK